MNSKQNKIISKKINNKIKNKIKKIKTKINKIGRRRQVIASKRRRRLQRMPAAYTRNFRKEFSILRQTGSSMRIKGRDLIYQIPDVLTSLGDYGIMTVIPANPAYWLGTRMAAIASGYQNYRPIKFNVSYVPQCAVTQQGNVLAGTLWSMSPNDKNIQQTLKTSNGGILTQCYKPARSKIALKTNLQFNLYRMGGKFNQESNPFLYIALSIATIDSNGTKINPGYFYVDYEYELKNPIGDTLSYYTSGLTQFENYNEEFVNETLINCSLNNVNPGAILQKDGDVISWNDKPVQIEAKDYVWFFCNQNVESEPINLELLYISGPSTITEITPAQIYYQIDNNGQMILIYNNSGSTVSTLISEAYLLKYTNSTLPQELLSLPATELGDIQIRLIPENFTINLTQSS